MQRLLWISSPQHPMPMFSERLKLFADLEVVFDQ